MFRFLYLALTAVLTASTSYAANQIVANCSNDTELRTKLTTMQMTGGGTLTFNCGAAPATIVLSGTILPSITATSTVDGGNKITISGASASGIFRNEAGINFTVRNINLINAKASASGGAIAGIGPLHIFNVRFENNQAVTGGAISSLSSSDIRDSEFIQNTATTTLGNGVGGGAIEIFGLFGTIYSISNSSFVGNSAGELMGFDAGGAIVIGSANLTITSSTFTTNRAYQGGAIYLAANSVVSATDSTFNTNTGVGQGGALYNLGSLNLNRVTLNDNSSASGGGIFQFAGSSNLTDATVALNKAQAGGGMFYSEADSTLINVTISGNAASIVSGGSGIYASYSVDAPRVHLTNTILASSGGNGHNCDLTSGTTVTISSSGFDLSDDSSCGFLAGHNNVNSMLGALANNGGPTLTLLPQSGSPAIDAGTNLNCPPIDQRGIDRPFGPRCDVGAVEVAPPGAPTATPVPEGDVVSTAKNLVNGTSGLVTVAKKILPPKPLRSLSKAQKNRIKAKRKIILDARSTIKSNINQLLALQAASGLQIQAVVPAFSKNNLTALKKTVSQAISLNEKNPSAAKKLWRKVSALLRSLAGG